MDLLKELEKERKERRTTFQVILNQAEMYCQTKATARTKCHLFQVSRKVNNNMDIRDFLKKVDNIQNKEQMKEDVKRIHVKEASQVMLYGDTPEDMNAIAQIFKNAGVTPPAPVEGPKPEAEEEEISATEEVPGKATTTPNPTYKDTKYMTKDLSGGANGPKKMYKKEYPGDNPMAIEQEDKTPSIKEELQKAYEDQKKTS